MFQDEELLAQSPDPVEPRKKKKAALSSMGNPDCLIGILNNDLLQSPYITG